MIVRFLVETVKAGTIIKKDCSTLHIFCLLTRNQNVYVCTF